MYCKVANWFVLFARDQFSRRNGVMAYRRTGDGEAEERRPK